MDQSFTFSEFLARFPDDDACLEEIKRLRFPKGIHCTTCQRTTKHYRVKRRPSYSCKFCRNHTYPLSDTLFEKTSTPLRLWFLALFLMTHTRDGIPVKKLQRELGVTYKTAWRMHRNIRILMEQNHGDLLKENKKDYREHRWLFFNKLEISWVEKQESKE